MEISNAAVVGLGIGTVFVALTCLVLICYITSAVVKLVAKGEKAEASIPQSVSAPKPVEIPNKGEFAAAVACAIAEDLGTDVTGIKIKSIKKL